MPDLLNNFWYFFINPKYLTVSFWERPYIRSSSCHSVYRLQFLDFQLDLIDDFRLRLVQLRIEDYMDILSSDVPAILNTLHYLCTVLVEWGTLPVRYHQYVYAFFGYS